MTVMTNGCFDTLHLGHCSLLRFCRQLAADGRVIVAINTDESVRRLKGSSRPIMDLHERVAAIHMLGIADEIVPFDGDCPTEIVRRMRPDVLVKGEQYRGQRIAGAEFAGRVEFAPMVDGVSTTRIIEMLSGDRRRCERQ